jgi:hypothetical protein
MWVDQVEDNGNTVPVLHEDVAFMDGPRLPDFDRSELKPGSRLSQPVTQRQRQMPNEEDEGKHSKSD